MRKKILVSTMALTILATTAAYAWGAAGTITVSSSQGWTTYTTINDTKSGTANDWAYEVYTKTMWSNPDAKLVNANNQDRSHNTTLTKGLNSNASGTWTTAWYIYYLSVKPAWNQTGSDTINLDIDLK